MTTLPSMLNKPMRGDPGYGGSQTQQPQINPEDGSLEAFIENRLSTLNFSEVDETGKRDQLGEIVRDKKNKAAYGKNRGQLIEIARQQFYALPPEQRTLWATKKPAVQSSPANGAAKPAPAAAPVTATVPAQPTPAVSSPAPATATSADPSTPVVRRASRGAGGAAIPVATPYGREVPTNAGRQAALPTAPQNQEPVVLPPPQRAKNPDGTPASWKVDPKLWTPEAIARSNPANQAPLPTHPNDIRSPAGANGLVYSSGGASNIARAGNGKVAGWSPTYSGDRPVLPPPARVPAVAATAVQRTEVPANTSPVAASPAVPTNMNLTNQLLAQSKTAKDTVLATARKYAPNPGTIKQPSAVVGSLPVPVKPITVPASSAGTPAPAVAFGNTASQTIQGIKSPIKPARPNIPPLISQR